MRFSHHGRITRVAPCRKASRDGFYVLNIGTLCKIQKAKTAPLLRKQSSFKTQSVRFVVSSRIGEMQ